MVICLLDGYCMNSSLNIIELSKASREIMAKASDKNCLLFEKGQTSQIENY